jgi:hypothetical protein
MLMVVLASLVVLRRAGALVVGSRLIHLRSGVGGGCVD